MAPANKNDPVMTEDYILQRSFAIVEKKCQQSNILQNNADKLLPRFQRAGWSRFCTVLLLLLLLLLLFAVISSG
jgi:hypothetical protein